MVTCWVILDNSVNMNMNYSNPATMYESNFAQMYVYLVLFTIFAFYHEKSFKPKLQKNIFLPEICTFGQNTLIHCSHRTVVHVHVNAFL